MSKPPFLALPPAARAGRLRTARGEFAVQEAGEPRLGTALLVPGFTGSKEDFIALLGPLAQAGFRVVSVDGRGQYETGGPREEEAYAQPELASDLLAMADALVADRRGASSPLHLLGHSLGGLIARAAVLSSPDAAPFASLTLLSSGPAAVSEGQRQRLRLLLGALPEMSMDEVWRAMRELDPVEAAEEETPPAVAEFLYRRWMANVPGQLAATAKQLMTEPDRVDELATASRADGGPRVHVLSGEVDYAWPVPWLDEMALRLGAPRTVIAHAAHSPNAERPAETARAIAGFWREAGH
jgi:pimeloyl-ACP methyl ester carboxylesterase